MARSLVRQAGTDSSEELMNGLPIRFVIGSLDVGGTETHLSVILPRLKQYGYEPFVQTLTHKGALAEKLEREGIDVLAPYRWVRFCQRIPIFSRILGPIATVIYLVCEFLRRPARLICFYLPASYLLGYIAARLTGYGDKTVMFRRSLNLYQEKRPLAAWLEHVFHRSQRAIVGNSRAIVDELILKEGAPPDKVLLIHNGIDISGYNDKSARESARRELGIAPDEVILCIVANLIPYKGHLSLLDALALVQGRTDIRWNLLCVGSGLEGRRDLIDRTKELGLEDRVKWLGRRTDVPRLLAASDIGLLVSEQEGFANSVLEGMASGLPMIVTDVGGNAEAVLDRECGRVVKPSDPPGLAEAIMSLIEDLDTARQYGKAARLRVERYFSLHACMENYEQLFTRLLND